VFTFFGLVGIVIGVTRPDLNPVAAPVEPITVAFTLRSVDGQFSVLSGGNHMPMGAGAVTQTSTYIRVNYTQPARQIVTLLAVSDDTLVRADVACGVRASLTHALIFCARDGVTINPSSIVSSTANISVFGLIVPAP
jgi:hypothetical protein